MILPMAIAGLGAFTPQQAQVQQMIVAAANTYGVPPALALGIASHESGFNPGATNLNTNGTTDYGVMQLNSTTVQTLGVADPMDPQQNIDAGVQLLAKYLKQYNGDTTKALWAYASGPGAVASGSMNSTATQFINYVSSYSPDPSLDLAPADISPLATPDDTSTDPFAPAPDQTYSIAGMNLTPAELFLGAMVLLTLGWFIVKPRG